LLVTKNTGELPDIGQTGYVWLKMWSYGFMKGIHIALI
jgi:hypothetical protein